MNKNKLISSFILVLALLLLLVASMEESEEPATGFAAHRVIAHAMGSINGHIYTNTLEAFVANYEQGSRIFETDLLLTADDRLVARHEWTNNMSKLLGQQRVLPAIRQGTVLDHAEFMQSPILGVYSPLDVEKLMDLMIAYPDAYIVTDTKELKPERARQQFEIIVQAAEHRDPSLLMRIVPQVYSRDMLEVIQQVHAFPEVIYTLYQSRDSDEQVIQFVERTGVNITMPSDRASKSFVRKLKKAGARVYVHTVNEEDEIVKLNRMGVDGFYTDFVSEDDLNRISALR